MNHYPSKPTASFYFSAEIDICFINDHIPWNPALLAQKVGNFRHNVLALAIDMLIAAAATYSMSQPEGVSGIVHKIANFPNLREIILLEGAYAYVSTTIKKIGKRQL